MAAVAHGWRKPGGGGPSRAVAREFNQADKQRAVARHLRKRRGPKRETEAEERAESPHEEVLESPEFERREHGGSRPHGFKRTGSMASAGASVGGGT